MKFNIIRFKNFQRILNRVRSLGNVAFFSVLFLCSNNLVNCVFRCETKWDGYLLEMRLVLISNYIITFTQNFGDASVNNNKNYTNLPNANYSLKFSVHEKSRGTEKPFLKILLCHLMKFNYNFWVKERLAFYFSRSSNSSKILFLLAIGHSVISVRIVTAHTRLHLEPLTEVYANML